MDLRSQTAPPPPSPSLPSALPGGCTIARHLSFKNLEQGLDEFGFLTITSLQRMPFSDAGISVVSAEDCHFKVDSLDYTSEVHR
jgi:hypothetical protein